MCVYNIRGVGTKSPSGLDSDYADRFSRNFTSILMLASGMIIGVIQYFGFAINCRWPLEFTGSKEQYAEQFCFVNSTYWANDTKERPPDFETREGIKNNYYQWAPWVLVLLALLSLVPLIIWSLLNWKLVINVKNVVKETSDLRRPEIREEDLELKVKPFAYDIEDALHMRLHYKQALDKNQNSRGMLANVYSYDTVAGSSFLTFLYLNMKLLNLLIAASQIFILQKFLDLRDSFYGWTLLKQWLNGETLGTVGLFPKVIYCDFAIRNSTGNKFQRYTMQCDLGINKINEKIFAFLWFWVLLVVIVSFISLIIWLDRVFFPFSRYEFISYLESAHERQGREENARNEEISPRRATKPKHLVLSFVNSFLGHDGVFLLRLVAWNAGIRVTSALMRSLYQLFEKANADANQEDRR